MKPQLPNEIRYLFPSDIVHVIQTFVPHLEPKSPPKTPSPSLQKELIKLQNITLRGKSSMYMIELDDFCLD